MCRPDQAADATFKPFCTYFEWFSFAIHHKTAVANKKCVRVAWGSIMGNTAPCFFYDSLLLCVVLSWRITYSFFMWYENKLACDRSASKLNLMEEKWANITAHKHKLMQGWGRPTTVPAALNLVLLFFFHIFDSRVQIVCQVLLCVWPPYQIKKNKKLATMLERKYAILV